MEEAVFYLKIFMVVLAALVTFFAVYQLGDNFWSLRDFVMTFKDKNYNYLSYVFRNGKYLRFVSDFPNNLRNACLGKNHSTLKQKKTGNLGMKKGERRRGSFVPY